MKGFTLWLTGLPCSGKSTLAIEIANELLERGLNVEILDGDELRTNLSKGLGFSEEDRITNIRRVGWVCKLLTRNDAIVICAVIAPYESARDENREDIGRYMEVFVTAPLETLIERDVKGMYKKALAGEIKNFTGIDDPYEPPSKPEVMVETDKETIEESTKKIFKTMELLGYLPKESIEDIVYTDDEENEIKSRLEDLGYI
jgi:adenylyl-sulfate kinase